MSENFKCFGIKDFEKDFEEKEFLNGFDSSPNSKILTSVDNFYVNSSLVSVSAKKGTEFIDVSDIKKKMYQDIYENNLKIPEVVDDNWVSASLSRYLQKDVESFSIQKSKETDFESFENQGNLKLITHVLNCFGNSDVKVNFEGLSVALKLEPFEDAVFDVKVVTSLREKLESKFLLRGRAVDFSAITSPAKNLKKYEILSLKIFVVANLQDLKKINFVFSKIGNKFSKVFVDDGNQSMILDFEKFGVHWGSFEASRRV